MNHAPTPDKEQLTDILGEVVDDYLEKRSQGKTPELSFYAALYPEHASAILQALRALEVLGQSMSAPSGDADHFEFEPLRKQLGDFCILRELGRGGMGIVFEAEQSSMGGRKVALKVLPFAAMVDANRLRRFRNEVLAVASLDHPNIVNVYSVGEERGVHYFAMQLIRGQSLAAVIAQVRELESVGHESFISEIVSSSTQDILGASRENSSGTARQTIDARNRQQAAKDRPSASTAPFAVDTQATGRNSVSTKNHLSQSQFYRSVAALGVQAAEALEHAHQQGIVHRDIKPANLMIDTQGKLYITDFGLAQFEQSPGLTLTGDAVGTLRYMAPEQALGNRIPIDHRVDVYGLGISLYELLGKQPAIRGENRAELLQQISYQEPIKLRQIDSSIPVDLDTIIHKAIAKAPAERYPTAQEFADDLRRYLEIQPIHARRASIVQQAMKWTARHQTITLSALTALLLIAIVAAIATWNVSAANQQLAEVNQNLRTQTEVAQQFEREARNSEAEALRSQVRIAEEKAATELQRNFAMDSLYLADMLQAARYYETGQIMQLHELLENHLPAGDDRDLRQWEWYYFLAQCYSSEQILNGHTRGVFDVKWSPNGTKLATCSADTTVRVWDAFDSRELQSVQPSSTGINAIDWSPDGKQIIAGSSNGRVFVWQLESSEEPTVEYSGQYNIPDVAFSPNGQFYCFGELCEPAAFSAWDIESSRQAARDLLQGEGLQAISWSPDSELVALAAGNRIVIWDIHQRKEIAGWKAHEATVQTLAYSYDGNQLASGAYDGFVKIWECGSWKEILTLNHQSAVNAVDWSPDDRLLVAATGGQLIQLWDAENGGLLDTFRGHSNSIEGVSWHPDGSRIASASTDRTVRIWDVTHLSSSRTLDSELLSNVTSSNGRFSATLENKSGEKLLVIRERDSDLPVLRVNTELRDSADGRAFVDFDKECQRIAVIDGNQVEVWSLLDRELLFELSGLQKDARDVCWSHDDQRIAASSFDGTVRLWNATTGDLEKTLVGHNQYHFAAGLCWSPDNTKLAAGGWDGTIRVWSLDTGIETQVLRGHSAATAKVSWSPDGERIAARAMDGTTIKIWDAPTGKEVLTLVGKFSRGPLHWNADGQQLISGATTFDASRGRQILSSNRYAVDAAWRYFDRAMELSNSGRFEDAEAVWQKALLYNPRLEQTEGNMATMSAAARFQFGYLLAQKGAYREAVKAYHQSIEIGPGISMANFAISDAFFELAEYDAAIESLVAASSRIPSSKQFRNLAAKFSQLRDYARALVCYEKAYEVEPAVTINVNDLAWILTTCPDEELRDCERAVWLAKKATEMESELPEFWNTLGVAHYHNQGYSLAVEALEKSIKLSNQRSSYDLFFLAMAKWKLGEKELASILFEEARDWMEVNAPNATELTRFKKEAENLINN